MKRLATGPLQGVALAIYFVLLPYVIVTKWNRSAVGGEGVLIRTLLFVLGLFWIAFLFHVGQNVLRLRRGAKLRRNGSAWLAGLVVVLLSLLVTPPHAAPTTSAHSTWVAPSESTRSTPTGPERPHRPSPAPLATLGALPMALVAKRRRDELRHDHVELLDREVEDAIAMLRAYDDDSIAALRGAIGEQRSGIVWVATGDAGGPIANTEPLAACVLDEDDQGAHVAFASEGTHLNVPFTWALEDIVQNVVALHDGGRLRFATGEHELLRALATRPSRSTMVLYLGASNDLEDDLRACTVTVGPIEYDEPWPSAPTSGGAREFEAGIVVELLRADPHVSGLVEPFAPTLRRRCVEMVAYLALHRREPVTGERLRTRVLVREDVDASTRTLANTASAVRRSLGADATGVRLHAVTPSGLYVTHGVRSDVEAFHALVTRARRLPTHEAAPLARRALALVKGEPLASTLRGFEWFLAEGHGSKLARDGEWAALVVHHDALGEGDYELAYWAIEQGRLIDPYNDALIDALARVPRLREFGSDRAGSSQHEPVGAGGAVAMGRSFDGLGNQIVEQLGKRQRRSDEEVLGE